MAQAVYLLCALTSVACAGLLFRSYRAARAPLLFWSCLAFVGLALNNVLLFFDQVIVPDMNLQLTRTVVAVAALAVLVGGLVWSSRS